MEPAGKDPGQQPSTARGRRDPTPTQVDLRRELRTTLERVIFLGHLQVVHAVVVVVFNLDAAHCGRRQHRDARPHPTAYKLDGGPAL